MCSVYHCYMSHSSSYTTTMFWESSSSQFAPVCKAQKLMECSCIVYVRSFGRLIMDVGSRRFRGRVSCLPRCSSHGRGPRAPPPRCLRHYPTRPTIPPDGGGLRTAYISCPILALSHCFHKMILSHLSYVHTLAFTSGTRHHTYQQVSQYWHCNNSLFFPLLFFLQRKQQ